MNCALCQEFEAVIKICHPIAIFLPQNPISCRRHVFLSSLRFLETQATICVKSWKCSPGSTRWVSSGEELQRWWPPCPAWGSPCSGAASLCLLRVGRRILRKQRYLGVAHLQNSSSPPCWSLQVDLCFLSWQHGFKWKQVKGANGFYISILVQKISQGVNSPHTITTTD